MMIFEEVSAGLIVYVRDAVHVRSKGKNLWVQIVILPQMSASSGL